MTVSRHDMSLTAYAVSLEGPTRVRVDIALSTTAAQSAALDEGIYDVWSTVDTFIRVNPTANDVTAATGYLLRANVTVPLYVRSGSKIGGILSSGTGTLSYHRVSWHG